jgi:hypothetical protein
MYYCETLLFENEFMDFGLGVTDSFIDEELPRGQF